MSLSYCSPIAGSRAFALITKACSPPHLLKLRSWLNFKPAMTYKRFMYWANWLATTVLSRPETFELSSFSGTRGRWRKHTRRCPRLAT